MHTEFSIMLKGSLSSLRREVEEREATRLRFSMRRVITIRGSFELVLCSLGEIFATRSSLSLSFFLFLFFALVFPRQSTKIHSNEQIRFDERCPEAGETSGSATDTCVRIFRSDKVYAREHLTTENYTENQPPGSLRGRNRMYNS